jgi:hypothetical protein
MNGLLLNFCPRILGQMKSRLIDRHGMTFSISPFSFLVCCWRTSGSKTGLQPASHYHSLSVTRQAVSPLMLLVPRIRRQTGFSFQFAKPEKELQAEVLRKTDPPLSLTALVILSGM